MSVIHTNNITNKDGTSGPTISGITTVSSTGFMRVPVGSTGRRLVSDFVPNSIIDDGLVLYLDAGISASYSGSGTTWTDLSGQDNNGTLVNGVSYNRDNGGSLVFDGVNDYVDCGNLTTLNDITIQMFVRPLSNAGSYRGFIGAIGGTGNDYDSGFAIDMSINSTTSFNKCHFEGGILRIPGGTNFMTSSIPFGTWTNICFSISPNYIQFYLNGSAELGTTRLNNVTSTIGMNNFRIGRRPSTDFLDGSIAQVSIYNRALSASEVQQNFNALRNRFSI